MQISATLPLGIKSPRSPIPFKDNQIKQYSDDSYVGTPESSKFRKQSKKLTTQVLNTVGVLLNNLKMAEESDKNCAGSVETDYDVKFSAEMAAMGLPTSFGTGKSNKKKTAEESNKTVGEVAGKMCRNKIKSAFDLIGLEFSENGLEKFAGQVEYKMKHIRLQNRNLKINSRIYGQNVNKHIYFDDDGNEMKSEESKV